jgi:hypothetical protein
MRIKSRVGAWSVAIGATMAVGALFVFRGCTKDAQLDEAETRRGAIVGIGDQGEEGDFSDFVSEKYALPRAFPSRNIADVQRKGPYQSLANIRSALGRPHISAQWLNAPAPQNCSPGCGEFSDCFQGQCFPLCGGGEFPCSEGDESLGLPDESCICVPVGTQQAPPPGLCGWVSVGPTNIHGRVTGLAIDPTNTQRVYASGVGGVWRSLDNGRRWQRVSDDIMIGTASFVAVNPVNPSEVFAGAGEPDYRFGGGTGVIRSTSGGDPGSWSDVSGTALASSLVMKLLFDTSATNKIYAATSSGVYTGTHTASGITWTRLGSSFGTVVDIAINFASTPPTIYASTETGDIRKWDGTNWNSRTSGIATGSAARIALALSPANPSILYARVSTTSGTVQGLYRTTTAAEQPSDAGVAWNLDSAPNASILDDSRFSPTSGYSWWGNFLVADPRSAEVVYSGGVGLFKRTAAGWTNISQGPDATFPLGVHSDQHVVVLDPSNADVVWVGNDGGINRSTPQSGNWHWIATSHGMVMTEDYQIATQQNFTTLVSAGTQDNGTMVTYGNRTWYPSADCDGSFVAVDPANASTIYGSGNCGLYVITQPVPYVAPGGQTIGITVPATYATTETPVVADPSVAHVALVAGVRKDPATDGGTLSGRGLLRTADGVTWTEILTLTNGGFTSMAISPSAGGNGKKSYYVGVAGPSIFSSPDEGATWNRTPAGLPADLQPNQLAIDWTNPARAVAAYGGGAGGTVVLTTNTGANWATLTATAPNTLPTGAGVTGVAIDPTDPNTIYAATSVGVFKGTLTPASNAVSFVPFDEGLPNGLDINNIYIDRVSKVMSIGSMGHGTYQRDITPGVTCPGPFLVARDSVYDRGVTPSPNGLPDPEHPIADTTRPSFFKPDDTPGGSVYWWDSTDIRIDVPSLDDAAHTIAAADNFEFESCPVEVTGCAAGTMIDRSPVRGSLANAYVQVTNHGLLAASNLRVVSLFTNATLEVPPLPANFWTTTFPANSASCGALDTSTGWSLVGCSTIPLVNPELPEVAKFPWNVPANAAEHSCMLTVVDSVDDGVPNTTRAVFDTGTLVPGDRHVAQRNLHVVDGPTTPSGGGGSGGGGGIPRFFFRPGGGQPSTPFHGIVDVLVPNRSGTNTTISVIVSPSGMTPDGKIQILLPTGIPGKTTGLPPVCGQATGTGGSSTAVVGIHLPSGIGPEQLALSADGRMAVADRVTVQESTGGFASMSNMGTTQSTFGTDLKAANLTSVPSVSLANRDALSGTLRTQGTVTKPSDATVAGGIFEHVQLQPGQTVSWNVAIPATSRGNVSLEPGHSQTIIPGRYGSVVVKTNATLRLSAGVYVFGSLDLEPQGTIVLDKSAGEVFVYVQTAMIERGTFKNTSGQLTDVFLGYLGTSDASIGAPFLGVIVAPSAKIILDTVGAPYTGSFFAKNLQVDASALIIHKQFRAFPALTTCSTLDPTETAKANALGLVPTLFGVPNHEITFQTTMTTGQTFRMGLRYESGNGQVDTAGRFHALLKRGGAIKGGSTFILRFR